MPPSSSRLSMPGRLARGLGHAAQAAGILLCALAFAAPAAAQDPAVLFVDAATNAPSGAPGRYRALKLFRSRYSPEEYGELRAARDAGDPASHAAIRETAKQCLGDVLRRCNGRPREGVEAEAEWRNPGGGDPFEVRFPEKDGSPVLEVKTYRPYERWLQSSEPWSQTNAYPGTLSLEELHAIHRREKAENRHPF